MSNLAVILKNIGFTVTGSDDSKSANTDMLMEKGIEVSIGGDDSLVDRANCVVPSLAILKNHRDIERAEATNKLILPRSELLGMLSRRYEKTIAISGSHGKSTVTAMVADIFKKGKMKATCHLGCSNTYENAATDLDYFITEACEYKQSFLSLQPNILAVVNVEYDHVDYYDSLEDVMASFKMLAKNAKDYLITTRELKEKLLTTAKVLTVGFTDDCTYQAKHITSSKGVYSYCITKNGVGLGRINLNVMGLHNLMNSLFAIAIADVYGICYDVWEEALGEFKGIKNRLEKISYENFHNAYRDYAHHPTEIRRTIEALKPLNKDIVVVFQPHTYSRTKELMSEFVTELKKAYKVILFKTYEAREVYDERGDCKTLYENIGGKNCFYADNLNLLEFLIQENVSSDDVLVFMGAGDFEGLIP